MTTGERRFPGSNGADPRTSVWMKAAAVSLLHARIIVDDQEAYRR